MTLRECLRISLDYNESLEVSSPLLERVLIWKKDKNEKYEELLSLAGIVKPEKAEAESLTFNLEQTEFNLITSALRKTHGSQKEAAKLLGITRRSLNYRMMVLKIPRPKSDKES